MEDQSERSGRERFAPRAPPVTAPGRVAECFRLLPGGGGGQLWRTRAVLEQPTRQREMALARQQLQPLCRVESVYRQAGVVHAVTVFAASDVSPGTEQNGHETSIWCGQTAPSAGMRLTLPGSSRKRAAKSSPSCARNQRRSSSPRQCASRSTKCDTCARKD